MTPWPRSTWTIRTAEPKGPATAEDRPEALIRRIRAEYCEMPGLCLTFQQACRLWHIDTTTCTGILDALVAESFLRCTPAGTFILASSGR